jgi:tetratricopeptide (TPR) repeat protein
VRSGKGFGTILQSDSGHAPTLTALDGARFSRETWHPCRAAFQRRVDADGSDPQQWVNLALACQNLRDEPGEESAIQRALTLDPMDLPALLLRGKLLERQGKTHQAARAYGAAATVAPPLERLHPDLRPGVSHALAYREKYNQDCASFLAQHLDSYYRTLSHETLGRFRESLDIMVGKKKRYDSRSVIYHFPHLAPIEFFERADFPWLDPIEAATDEIRDEFIEVLRAEEDSRLISRTRRTPQAEFAELNNSPRWSAFHLYKMGERIDENAAKCPKAMKALASAPKPDQPGRTPAAMFRCSNPRPHSAAQRRDQYPSGHAPRLIIPEGCGLRVGDTRKWVPARIGVRRHHRARGLNDSDKLRVVHLRHLAPASHAAGAGDDNGDDHRPERLPGRLSGLRSLRTPT